MSPRTEGPAVSGKAAVLLFVLTLFAFAAESQLTQYVQTTLGYRQPFFVFYIVHSSFAVIFPLHLFYLCATTKSPPSAFINGLRIAISNHLSDGQGDPAKVPRHKFFRLILWMTVGVSLPGLLWFAAITLASISDVTAIWNSNAFFAYIISVKVFHLQWEIRRLGAVLVATLGVLVLVYGGSRTTESESEFSTEAALSPADKPSAPLVGDLLTLVASIGYGLYQVLYKKYAALPSDPELAYEPLSAFDGEEEENDVVVTAGDVIYPPPFGLHPNMLTTAVGISTFLLLWIPIPVLHILGTEPFYMPPNFKTVVAIAGIAFTGVIFNAGFMILLGLWGPIMTSVGGLLTIVLVFISDLLFGTGASTVTLWSVVGSGAIITAFGILAHDMFMRRRAPPEPVSLLP